MSLTALDHHNKLAKLVPCYFNIFHNECRGNAQGQTKSGFWLCAEGKLSGIRTKKTDEMSSPTHIECLSVRDLGTARPELATFCLRG